MKKIALLALVAWFSLLSTDAAPAAADAGEELIAAAQQGDLAGVERLLEAGTDVDSKNRYGATALFFATDKANAEMVALLLEKGASVDVVDTFYGARPLDWALFKVADSPPHRAIILQLLAAGPEQVGGALNHAATAGDAEIAAAVLALERSTREQLRAAATAAGEAGHDELSATLEEHAAKAPEPERVEIARETLESYVGSYLNAEIELEAKVFLEEGTLRVQAGEQPPIGLSALSETTFEAVEVEGVEVTFQARAGSVESVTLNQGGREFVFARLEPSAPTEATAAAPPAEPEAAPLPEAKRTAAKPWPSFRGPKASGIGDGQGAPFEWDGAEGANVLWKTPIPGIGLSSPIVWGDRVYLTTAISKAKDETFRIGLYGDVDSVDDASVHEWKIYALDRNDGSIAWERTAARGVPKVARHTKSSHANPTPVTDGQHVVAHFGSEGIFTYDAEGELLWKLEVPKLVSGWFYDPTYEWGYSSSPILHDGLVIVQTDIQEGSYIAAYDVATGEERWRTERDEIPTWGTPNVLVGEEGAEIVTNGTTVRGYDAATGEELWTLGPNSEVTVGTPILGAGVAYVTGGYPPVRPIYAIRPGGRGDLSLAEGETTSETVAWSTTRGGTYIPTPILYEDILYMLHNNGRLTAHEADTGEEIYRARVGTSDSFAGSPVAADGRLFFTNEEGRTYVVRSGPVYSEIGRNELGEIVMTTPAISDGMMIVRGLKHVWALGAEATGDRAQASEGR